LIADDETHPASRFEWERLVRRSRLSPATKLVAYTLAQYSNRDGTRCRPGNGRLTATTGYGDRAVRYALEQLRDVGLIARVFRGGSAGRRGLADEYRLTVPDDWLDGLQSLQPDERTPAPQCRSSEQNTGTPVPQFDAGTPAPGAGDKSGTPALGDTEHWHPSADHQPIHQPGEIPPSGGMAADARVTRGDDDECPHGDPRGPTGCALCRQAARRATAATAPWDRANAY
jgi:DNA-binding transcriptional ArsR family regulator